MDFLTKYYDNYDAIKKQNDKSKEILQECEKIANKKKENNKKEEIELNNEIYIKKNEILIFNKEKLDLSLSITLENLKNINIYEIYKKIYDIDNKILCIKDRLDSMEAYLRKIISRDIFPHGNNIFEIALLYYDISVKIGIEWKHYIYTWTVLGYKCIYPKHALDYIQYKKDIKTSKFLMINIEKKLKLEGKNIYIMNEDAWIYEINNYLHENNITIDENLVFRPYKSNKNDIQYYRITKNNLINSEIDYDVIDYSFLFEYDS